MNLTLSAQVQTELEAQLGRNWPALMAPVEMSNPAGPWLRGSAVYLALQDARSADDATLPMGAWQHELKHADWPRVREIAVQALCEQSKDLQIAVWLLEAQIQLRGLAGIAPGLWLLAGLLDSFWPELHPLPQDDDTSHRANLLRWVNRKLLAPLKLTALTKTNAERQHAWADLESARRTEKLQAGTQRGDDADDAGTGPHTGVAAVQAALWASPSEWCLAQHAALQDALAALAALNQVIDRCFTQDAPSLGHFATVLQDMLAWYGAELRRRGLSAPAAAPVQAAAATQANRPGQGAPLLADPLVGAAPNPVPTAASSAVSTAVPNAAALPAPTQREQAYAMLAAACETLRRIEPHSPVPYVVQRAIAWGSLNTAELYMELFVRSSGQINIFELLGIAEPQHSAAAESA